MKLNVILICDKPKIAENANTIIDHINAFESYSRHNIYTCSIIGDLPNNVCLESFDVVIVHYSSAIIHNYYLSLSAKEKLSAYQGLKILFVQDEYRSIDYFISELIKIKFDVLFTCFPESEIENVYPAEKLPHVTKVNTLTGYISETLLRKTSLPKIKDRYFDVIYRSRKLPFFYGELGYEKWSIVDRWNQHTKEDHLKCDLSYHEQDRVYGSKWTEFLSSSKTTLGVESGASVMDFTGKLEILVEFHQRTFPEDSFHEIQNIYLRKHEGKYKLNQISPRCFEAIALKTVLVLYEGEYSGILVPDRHYISLKKDFSNIRNVVARIKNDSYLQDMADLAYEEIGLSEKYSYVSFIKNVDELISKEFRERKKRLAPNRIIDFSVRMKCNNGLISDQIAVMLFIVKFLRGILRFYQKFNFIFRYIKPLVTQRIRIFNPILHRLKNKANLILN